MKPEYWHVFPVGDAEEHNTKSQGNCWCNPKIEEQENGNWVVVHNSLDGREMKNLYYSQVFWKNGANSEGYYTRKQLRSTEIDHYTVFLKNPAEDKKSFVVQTPGGDTADPLQKGFTFIAGVTGAVAKIRNKDIPKIIKLLSKIKTSDSAKS